MEWTVVFTFVGIIGGGLVGWAITDYYSRRSSKELNNVANEMLEAIYNQGTLIKSLAEKSINPQEALNENSKIVTKVVKQVNEVNRNYRVHVNTPRCTTCGSDSHWNGLRCMNCGAMDDGDY